ncbi:MAG: hypothetical protein JW702_10000 [Clostridiales bacterium]|nr:hypothetical protein [Clostridiales bacterium]
MYVLGIDTSNYTTSLALSDEYKSILLDIRIPLKVSKGQVGLRQSDAYYQHIQNLTNMIDEVKKYAKNVEKIVVSTQPRNHSNSYMPVFNAGVFFTKALNFTDSFHVIELSHQEGHIFSAWEKEFGEYESLFVLHISGGTTELLKVEMVETRLKTSVVYQTLDISFGQLLDRVGNYMNLDFPAGKFIDEYAKEYKSIKNKISYSEKGFNLSGMENKFKHMYDETGDVKLVSNSIMSYLVDLIEFINKKIAMDSPFLIIGGVGESEFLRKFIKNKNVVFAKKGLSSDNAVGLSQYPFIMEDQ